MRPFPPKQEIEIERLYNEGLTDYGVASIMHVGRDRLRKWRRLKGLRPKLRSKGLNVSLCPAIRKRLDNGETLTSIGLSLGVNRTSIMRLLKKEHKSKKDEKKQTFFSMTPDVFKNLHEDKKNEVIEQAFDYYRQKGFPHLTLDTPRLIKISKTVTSYTPSAEKGLIKHCTIGQNFCEHFFPHIYEASRYDRKAPLSIWNDNKRLKKFLRNRFTYPPKFNDASLRRGMKITGSVCNFKPTVAKYVYQKYMPDKGKTYDFSAGYGGRLLGFLSSGRKGTYVGIDPMKKTCRGLREMADFWKRHVDSEPSVIVHEGCAEHFRKEKDIDVVFSCPPYFDLERYSDDPSQSYIRYRDYEKWLKGFWERVVINSFHMLKSGGFFVYVINNYSVYDLISDSRDMCSSAGFFEVDHYKVPMANMFLKKKTGSDFKYENMFVYRKASPGIRIANETDVKNIIKIVEGYYAENLMGMYPSSFYYRAQKNGNIIVSEDKKGALIGFVVYRYMKRTGAIQIIQIACLPEKRGTGTTLLQEVSKKRCPMYLKVKSSNKGAIEFYQRCGFYARGEGETVRMEKEHCPW